MTSYTEDEHGKDLEALFPIFDRYNDYKIITPYPAQLISMLFYLYYFSNYHVSDYEWKNKLKFVRIYFDTPTFDRITKDKAAKFVDMLSAIGCTMGLLTGFSIIGAVAWSLVPGEVEPHPGVGEVLHHVHHLVHLGLLQARPASQPNLPSDEPSAVKIYFLWSLFCWKFDHFINFFFMLIIILGYN